MLKSIPRASPCRWNAVIRFPLSNSRSKFRITFARLRVEGGKSGRPCPHRARFRDRGPRLSPGTASAVALGARRPTALVEPRAVLGHFRALPRRRTSLARRRLFALLGGAPSQLNAVVEVVCHLEFFRAVGDILQRQRP